MGLPLLLDEASGQMSESVETRLARLEAKFEFILDDMREAKTSRKAQYEMIDNLNNTVTHISGKVDNVETKLAGQAPTIEEFITIKHRVVGAGKLGKYIWLGAGAIITFIWSSREAIIQFLVGGK